MRRATLCRRLEEARDRASLDTPKPVANVSRELELLRLNRALQPVTHLVRSSAVGNDGARGRLVSPADVPRAAVNPAQEVAHALLEGVVTMSAAEAAS